VYASRRVGARGRVVAIEPAADNVSLLRENIAANALDNVVVRPVAAGRAHEVRTLFLRGGHSAVNSLFETSVYATVTAVEPVQVAPVDDLVDADADLVKIDVEGAEVEVLLGMTRLLRLPRIRLIVEWHPRLQEAAGYAPDALPRLLLEQRFMLQAAWHTHTTSLTVRDIHPIAQRLRRSGRPVELVAQR
jgi:FkbM family methyltransferase